jgi:hypothetical protein
LTAIPHALRAACKKYQIEIDDVTDTELIENLEWENIKLDPSGTVECYVRNSRVTTNYDIALGFDKHHKLYKLHFDG